MRKGKRALAAASAALSHRQTCLRLQYVVGADWVSRLADVVNGLLDGYGARHVGMDGAVVGIRARLIELIRVGLARADDRSAEHPRV